MMLWLASAFGTGVGKDQKFYQLRQASVLRLVCTAFCNGKHPEAYQTSYAAPSHVPILGLLSEIHDSVSVDTTSVGISDDHREYLKILDWRIRNIPKADTTDEAFELAALIYLNRISGPSLDDQPLRTQQRIDKAFAVLSQLNSCERQFPVFVLGCEARTDDQRVIVLDLISKTEGNVASRSFRHIKLLLEAIWAQDDLVDRQHGDRSYWNKLSSAMRSYADPPCFV